MSRALAGVPDAAAFEQLYSLRSRNALHSGVARAVWSRLYEHEDQGSQGGTHQALGLLASSLEQTLGDVWCELHRKGGPPEPEPAAVGGARAQMVGGGGGAADGAPSAPR